jgi:hypothetical protein
MSVQGITLVVSMQTVMILKEATSASASQASREMDTIVQMMRSA